MPKLRLRRSALDWIAAALAAAAIFAAPGILVGLLNGGLRGWELLYGLLGLAAAVGALMVHVRRREDARGIAVAAIVGGAALAWIVAIGSFIVVEGSDLCGGGTLATTVSWVGFFLVYCVVASWTLLGRYRPLWGLPLAVLLAAATHYGALALIPGGRGYCET